LFTEHFGIRKIPPKNYPKPPACNNLLVGRQMGSPTYWKIIGMKLYFEKFLFEYHLKLLDFYLYIYIKTKGCPSPFGEVRRGRMGKIFNLFKVFYLKNLQYIVYSPFVAVFLQ